MVRGWVEVGLDEMEKSTRTLASGLARIGTVRISG